MQHLRGERKRTAGLQFSLRRYAVRLPAERWTASLPRTELFMPPALARNKEYMWKKRFLFLRSTTTAKSGSQLVQTTLRHLVERYGMEEVRQWKFTSIQLNPEKPLRFSILSNPIITTFTRRPAVPSRVSIRSLHSAVLAASPVRCGTVT